MDAKFTYAQAVSSWLIEILFFAHAKRFGNAMAIETIEYTRKRDVNRGFKNEIQNSGVTVRHEGRFSRSIFSGQFPSRFAAIWWCSILFCFCVFFRKRTPLMFTIVSLYNTVERRAFENRDKTTVRRARSAKNQFRKL